MRRSMALTCQTGAFFKLYGASLFKSHLLFFSSLQTVWSLPWTSNVINLVLLKKHNNMSSLKHVAGKHACIQAHTRARTLARTHTPFNPPIRNRLPRNRCCSKANYLYRDCVHIWLFVCFICILYSCLSVFSGVFITSGLMVITKEQVSLRSKRVNTHYLYLKWKQFTVNKDIMIKTL